MENANFTSQLSEELSLSPLSVQAVIKLLDEGNTIPFIARYRKEATHNLDETQIRAIQERRNYLIEFEDRRRTIIHSIENQGKMTSELLDKIRQCETKTDLEDLYLPYKPKRRTKAIIAREKGLEPLANLILQQPIKQIPEQEALPFINPELNVHTVEEALQGARDIVAEVIAENADVRKLVREFFAEEGMIHSKVIEGVTTPTKFEQYYDYKEPVKKIPSHRYLAIRRGENEGVLSFSIAIDPEPVQLEIKRLVGYNELSPFAKQLEKALLDSYKRLIVPSVETDVRVELKLASDKAAVEVFADNLKNLLMAAPLGEKNVIGVDPGIRTGCKCAAVDDTGKYLDHITFYTHSDLNRAKKQFLEFVQRFNPFAIGVGNGTAGRETEAFVRGVLKEAGLSGIIVVPVSEAGASVYSASDIAREEFPELDLTIRGAISIARRLQDPLAELVKIDPKAIGVGQYQHDVYQPLLQDKLTEVVESCVNNVGVELNTASAPLLANVSGIGPSLAQKIVKYREEHGAFRSRHDLLSVAGLGAKTFEQAAGFLRLHQGEHPLDASAVHPERYSLVEQMAHDLKVPLKALIANQQMISLIEFKNYANHEVGELTLKDIIEELKKPGRDPRASFEMPAFREDVSTMNDLKQGMKLEGIVTNVTAFGAFVDVGVHQDGLIHISQLTDRYIKDPSEVVHVGMKIQVEVIEVDVERKRISLTAKIGRGKDAAIPTAKEKRSEPKLRKAKEGFSHNPFASL